MREDGSMTAAAPEQGTNHLPSLFRKLGVSGQTEWTRQLEGSARPIRVGRKPV